MIKRKRTQVVVLGELEISGSKIVHKRLSEPKASIKIFNKNFIIYPAPDVRKIIFRVPIKYKEATTKQDTPNFSFALKQNGKEIKKVQITDEDVYAKYEEIFSLLDIEIDLEKYNYKNLEFDAQLECWLEARKWKAEAYAPYENLSAEENIKIKINFDAPELSLEIFPTHSPGKDLKSHINTDWGNPYFLNLHLNNKTDETIETPGGFSMFENYNFLKDATLKENLAPKQNTIIISDKNKHGAATWILEKGPEDWSWYEQDKKDKNKFTPKKELNKIYRYYATGDLKSEYVHWENLESNHLLVNVRVPDYKIKALDVYNLAVDLKDAGDYLLLALGAELIALLRFLPAHAVSGGVAGLIAAFLSGKTIGDWADEVEKELNKQMDDPPVFDKNYKVRVLLGANTERKLKNLKKIKNEKLAQFLFNSKSFVEYSKAARISNNRLFSAKMKLDRIAMNTQQNALRKYVMLTKKSLIVLSYDCTQIGENIGSIAKKVRNKKMRRALVRFANAYRKFGKGTNELWRQLKWR